MASNASHVTRHRLRHDQPWRRKRDRRRIVPVGSFESMLAVIPSLPRQSLARLVQQAIDRMDDLDGDPDLGPVRMPTGKAMQDAQSRIWKRITL